MRSRAARTRRNERPRGRRLAPRPRWSPKPSSPPGRPGPGRSAALPSRVEGAGAGTGSARADARVPVHLLPWRRAADGRGSRADAHVRAAGAAMRGRAPGQLRGVRVSGATPGLRRERLRRDASRSVRMGRQAARREPGSRGAGQRIRQEGPSQDRPGRGGGIPHGDAGVRRPTVAGGLVRAPGHRGCPRAAQVEDHKQAVQGERGTDRARTHPGQHPGAEQAHDPRRRAAADHQRPSPDRPDGGRLRRDRRRRAVRDAPLADRQVPSFPADRPTAPARAVHARPGGPQGGRRRQRGNPCLDPVDGHRPRRRAVGPAG